VVLGIKPNLLDRRVSRDESGYSLPRLIVCFGRRPIRHNELSPVIVQAISAVFVIHSAFLGGTAQKEHKKRFIFGNR